MDISINLYSPPLYQLSYREALVKGHDMQIINTSLERRNNEKSMK